MQSELRPAIVFIEGVRIERTNHKVRQVLEHQVIGRVGTTYFKIDFDGKPRWHSLERLGQNLTQRILRAFKKQILDAEETPNFIEVRDLGDTTLLEYPAPRQMFNDAKWAYHRDVWRAKYLNDKDDDYPVKLNVPYEERDLARGCGAKWDPTARAWRVKSVEDATPEMHWAVKRWGTIP